MIKISDAIGPKSNNVNSSQRILLLEAFEVFQLVARIRIPVIRFRIPGTLKNINITQLKIGIAPSKEKLNYL